MVLLTYKKVYFTYGKVLLTYKKVLFTPLNAELKGFKKGLQLLQFLYLDNFYIPE